MYTAAFPIRAKSANRDRERYKRLVRFAFERALPTVTPLDGELYAAVYFFHDGRVPVDDLPDADNLSKPVLDALKGVAYGDDRQVLLRTSGLFDLRTPLGVLNLTRVPKPTLQALLSLLNRGPHVLYVEVGRLHYEQHFRFGSEISA